MSASPDLDPCDGVVHHLSGYGYDAACDHCGKTLREMLGRTHEDCVSREQYDAVVALLDEARDTLRHAVGTLARVVER